ncbi:MAG: hypothetical protein OHK0029_41550 [Armatimonadaceae bacterium]
MADIVKPSAEQVAWQEAELTLFLHFGVNTFTDREWGDGKEDPRIFNPVSLDARQWTRVAKEAGFKYVILTAKHHDGFCLWQSEHTSHSVKSSPWKNGKGDVVREFADVCRADGLKVGLYLSPWDRNAPMYGDSPAYNRYYVAQLTELLTRYGMVSEVWFDGANGEGPNGKKQEYDWQEFYRTIRRHQPKALIAITGPDIRWVGNEDRYARETEWSVQPAHPTIHAGQTSDVWWPAECDTSIRPGWFWHRAEDSKVKSLEHLMDIYFKSVGRNSVLLLNVPPNDKGLIPDPDVQRLREFRATVDRLFAKDLALGKPASATSAFGGHDAGKAVDGSAQTRWIPRTDDATPALEVDMGSAVTVGITSVQEFISEGQRVERYRIEAETETGWQEVARGTTIGHKKLDRFPPVRARKFRVTLDSFRAAPQIRAFGLFAGV